MGRQRTAARLALAALAAVAGVLTSTGAGCDPAPGPSPPPPPAVDRGDLATPPGDPLVRHSVLKVPGGLAVRDMHFVDADTGYLLFGRCAGGCDGALFVTFDGGQSWLRRELPVVAGTESLQVVVVDPRSVVFVARPKGWFRSTDAGRTFTRGGDGEPDSAVTQPGVAAGCPGAGACVAQVLLGGRPVAVQPPLPGQLRQAAGAGDGVIWAVSDKDGAIHTARSSDGGSTWQRFGPPLVVADPGAVQLALSPDGKDVWLVTGPGTSPVAVYVAEGPAWRPVGGRSSPGSSRVSAAAAGGGVLALGGDNFGYLTRAGTWTLVATTRLAPSVRAMRDGTLSVSIGVDDVWLGTGQGVDRSWAHVTVEPG